MIMRKVIIILLYCFPFSVHGQTITIAENDRTVMTEYNDGLLWAYKQIGDFVVGMTNYVNVDDYGKNYQIQIFIKNLGEESITFNPALISSTLYNKHDEMESMKVYSYESYIKRVKRQQNAVMISTGINANLNAHKAGYQTTHTTTYGVGIQPYTQIHTTYNPSAALVANAAARTQMMTLSKLMSDETKMISKDYLRITTVHPDEGIIGYLNIKHKKGTIMTVDIPVGEHIFTFNWNVSKRK